METKSPRTPRDIGEISQESESAAGARLRAAAERALAEAAERRARPSPPPPREINGRDGPEPTRYGDWEVKGRVSDF